MVEGKAAGRAQELRIVHTTCTKCARRGGRLGASAGNALPIATTAIVCRDGVDLDYYVGGKYLRDRYHPGDRIAISFYQN